MNQSTGHNDREPDLPGPTAPTWADVQAALESIQPKNWKALSEIPREWPVVKPPPVVESRNLIPSAEMAHTGTPRSFLRWCGHQTQHAPHGRCDGVV